MRMDRLGSTDRTTLHRSPARAVTDRAALHAILDEGLVCHVGFVDAGSPFVLPTLYGRDGERLYLHGSTGSRMMRVLGEGGPVCVTVTLVDGLVLARSVFHHSMNYRSAVVLGQARAVTDPGERLAALQRFTEHLIPGRWDAVRPPSRKEMAATAVLALDLEEASVKMRTGPPGDDEQDLELPVWGGVLPLSLVPGPPVDDPLLPPGLNPPTHVTDYHR
jgi:nitroimidazol reductase NimA-like FMN-containing flavoprotein (pyridoxamine 5'-phosphate oxidase superfamily)